MRRQLTAASSGGLALQCPARLVRASPVPAIFAPCHHPSPPYHDTFPLGPSSPLLLGDTARHLCFLTAAALAAWRVAPFRAGEATRSDCLGWPEQYDHG
ncbi:hypothetical protein NL676_034203 [Syzygium grande]|nr:hypothetical protein NL676_034203 [Syzygium grande]